MNNFITSITLNTFKEGGYLSHSKFRLFGTIQLETNCRSINYDV